MDTIYFCAGDKGGTGKSMAASALMDELLQRGTVPILIETDTANPDVLKTYQQHEEVKTLAIGLDDGDGWIQLINSADQNRGTPIVVNTAARSGAGTGRYGPTLLATLPKLGRRLVTLWVINRQRDSLELLADYLESMPIGEHHQAHVLRNLYFGVSTKFELYNGSDIKRRPAQQNRQPGCARRSAPPAVARVGNRPRDGRHCAAGHRVPGLRPRQGGRLGRRGYMATRNEAAAASWANTPEGQLAFQMAAAGSLPLLARCSEPGWKRSDGVCFPFATADGTVHGWQLPSR